MAATPGAGHIAGIYTAQIMFRDANGYPMGNLKTPNSPSNGTVYNAYKLTGPVSFTAPEPTIETAEFKGGMDVLGALDLGIASLGTFQMTLSADDEVLRSYINGSTNDVTNAGTENVLSAPNSENLARPQFHLVLTTGFQTLDGTNRYQHWMYPNVTIREGSRSTSQDGGTNPNPLTYTVTPSKSTRTTLGYLFSATGLGVTNNRDIVTYWRTNNLMTFATYVDDGADTSVNVGYLPITSDVDGSNNVITKNGVDNKANISALSTTTGATTHTAGTAADIWVISYATRFVTP